MTASGTKSTKALWWTLGGDDVSFDEVLKNVEERDYIDTHRDNSSHKGRDIEIDNSYLAEKNNLMLFYLVNEFIEQTNVCIS
jgi:cytidylate kinase